MCCILLSLRRLCHTHFHGMGVHVEPMQPACGPQRAEDATRMPAAAEGPVDEDSAGIRTDHQLQDLDKRAGPHGWLGWIERSARR